MKWPVSNLKSKRVVASCKGEIMKLIISDMACVETFSVSFVF